MKKDFTIILILAATAMAANGCVEIGLILVMKLVRLIITTDLSQLITNTVRSPSIISLCMKGASKDDS